MVKIGENVAYGVAMIYYKNECYFLDYEFQDVIKIFFSKDELIKLDGPWDQNSGAFLFCRAVSSGQDNEIIISFQDEAFDEYANIMLPQELADLDKSNCSKETLSEKLKALRKTFKRKLFLLLEKYTQKVIPWGVMTGIRPTKLVHELLDRGSDKKEIIRTLIEDYFVTKEKAELLYEVAVNQRALFENSDIRNVSLYIGIPFCPTRCLYCSFSSSTIGQYKKAVDTYIDTLLKEIKHTATLIRNNGQRIESIYIGGGTPTSINSKQLDKLLQGIEELLDLGHLQEYTLEAGRPDTIDVEKLKVIKNSRVTRISINPQSMNTSTLERIGRNHTPAAVETAFYLARELGFDNINMDVICGLPGEDVDMFKKTMDRLAQLKPESITVHTMAIKRASRLTLELDNYSLHEEFEQVAEMVRLAGQYAEDMGLKPYYLYRQKNILGNLENVGYSQQGKECLYNIQIMEERQSIYACGAGAVTKLVFSDNRIERVFNVKTVEEYIGRIDEMLLRKEIMLRSQKSELRSM